MLKSWHLIRIFPFTERITVSDEIFIDKVTELYKNNKILKLSYVWYYKLERNKSLK